MDEALKTILIDLCTAIEYALVEIEHGCQPDLTWEKGQLTKLQERLYDL